MRTNTGSRSDRESDVNTTGQKSGIQNADRGIAPSDMRKNTDTICYIPLGKGKRSKRLFAIVDREDYDRVMQHKWYAVAGCKTFYVCATTNYGLPNHHTRLHAFIMKAEHGQKVDHKDGNGLDCRKENLRFATSRQNSQNAYKTTSPHVTSRYKGVSLSSSGKWIAQITIDGDPTCIGLFDDETEAALAYDSEAVKHFGGFAKTNADMGLFDNRKADRPSHEDMPPYQEAVLADKREKAQRQNRQRVMKRIRRKQRALFDRVMQDVAA